MWTIGLMLAVIGGIGAAGHGLFLLFSLLGVMVGKATKNDNEHYQANENTARTLGKKVAIGLVALVIGLLLMRFFEP